MGLRAVISRIYRGEISADIVGKPKIWYSLSGALLILSIAGLLIQGLNFGVEFKGGSVFTFQAPRSSIEQVRGAATDGGAHDPIVQKAGEDWRITTQTLSSDQVTQVKATITKELNVPASKVSTQVVGASWGGEIQKKAWQALVVFMILIIGYLSVAFEWRMAVAAVVALVHDLIITAGVYALVGFEISPATMIGFLTILGYSLYDTVVVFDKVRENTKEELELTRRTFPEAVNLAVNQTLVRSINTAVVAVLPVASILFIGAYAFGAATLRDISLALLIGIIVGTYSTIFLAAPMYSQFREKEPAIRKHDQKVLAIRPKAAVKTEPVATAAE